ncbi:IclR family transcriptional regulator [Paenibacillus aceris]|uniref:DNA-binding IclR family transcriptional regulator n=1 Tax=Paenibacillus aceris TaxID=869555 RepID=A0ABS4I4J9_9BACL|nr:IclR family transcriptional regulator [Paenibacillus aceris]MBP1965331.1 DNA-binding IclR family transcriptional regulator [Paenibacillus aceris]NHW36011.1 IclR family transcriptional regulator [Paenibacillus aceris]
MERKYWVPALERANNVLLELAGQPSKLKLMDLSAATGINKSTMFSLLQTMETLNWVNKEKGDTYSLGSVFGIIGNAYFAGMNLVKQFEERANHSIERIGEAIQLARLEKGELVYLAKKEAATHVRLISEPGMRLPAYATAMGKVLLSELDNDQVLALYKEGGYQAFTPNTVQSGDELLKQLQVVRERGYAIDLEEIALGFCCIAVPVVDRNGSRIAAVSCSMSVHQWPQKQELAKQEIEQLAHALSATI